jgi:lipopolysaccharide transport system permease protein
MASTSSEQSRVRIIEPGSMAKRFWTDLWRYRELFFVLAWRDIAVRYKQTIMGFSWAIIRPLITMVVFTVIFGKILGLASASRVPYALLVFAGVLPWTLFSTALTDAANSVVGNPDLVRKVYFPRIIIPTATIVIGLVDFLISLAILFGLMVFYRFMPGWQIAALPAFALMAALAALGPGLYFAAMIVKYRDFRILVPFALQFGLYVSPVGFSSSLIPETWRPLYRLNPMVGIVDGFRWSILGDASAFDWQSSLISVVVISLMLVFGIGQFRKLEAGFVDAI